MEFIQIQSFLAVAELLNFSQAAKKVFLSQPAVSHQIHSLEKELGFLTDEFNEIEKRYTEYNSDYNTFNIQLTYLKNELKMNLIRFFSLLNPHWEYNFVKNHNY